MPSVEVEKVIVDVTAACGHNVEDQRDPANPYGDARTRRIERKPCRDCRLAAEAVRTAARQAQADSSRAERRARVEARLKAEAIEQAERIHAIRVRPGIGGSDGVLATLEFQIGPLVVRDVRIVQTTSGPGIAFPNRPVTLECEGCAYHIPWSSKYCQNCGIAQPPRPFPRDAKGRPRRYVSQVFPRDEAAKTLVDSILLTAFANEARKEKTDNGIPGS